MRGLKEKLIRDGALDVAKKKTHRYAQYPNQAQNWLVVGDEGLSGPNKQNNELIGLCRMNQIPKDSEKSIKVKIMVQSNHK